MLACDPGVGLGEGGLFKISCQVTVMTQEADADGRQCLQQTPTDTHRSRPFLCGICPRLSMCRMDRSVSRVCKVCSAEAGGHMGHPATSQSIEIISALATPAHPSNPTPQLCTAPTVSRGNSPTTLQTSWPVCFFISVGTTASSPPSSPIPPEGSGCSAAFLVNTTAT